MRADDIEDVVDTIRMIRYVQTVKLGPVVDHMAWRAADQFRCEMGETISAVIDAATGMIGDHSLLKDIRTLIENHESRQP